MNKKFAFFHNLSLTTKLSLVSAMLMFSAFFGISYFNYQNARKTLHDKIINDELPLLTENIHFLVQKELETPISITEMNAKNPLIIDWLTNGGEKNNPLLYQYLNEIKGKKGIKTINLISDKTKNLYNETGRYKKIDTNLPVNEWYLNLKKNKSVKEFNTSYSKEGVLSFFINHKIFDTNNQFIGITAVGLPIEHIVKNILTKKIGKNGNIFLINQEGFIKVHNDKNIIHKNKNDSLFKNINHLTGIKEIAAKILKNKTASFEYKKKNDVIFLHSKFIPEFNWILIIEISEEEILAPVFTIFVSNIISSSIITIVIFVLMIIIFRYLVLQPLKIFEKGLLDFFDFLNRKNGKKNAHVNLYYQDELGKMAQLINENILYTQEGINKDNDLIAEVVKIIEIVSEGILTPQVHSIGQNPELNHLRDEINEMLSILQHKVGKDINTIIEVMSAYQELHFDNIIADAEAEIEQKVNEMGKSILEKQKKIDYQNNEILAQKEEVEEINKQMKSSIEAAKIIQKAVFPYQEKMDKLLKEYFVIYEPKDGVSGDFFWLNEINNKIILAVADCTGHGVPGAFMTLIGSILLDKIIRVWDIDEPKRILEKLHEEVWTVLRQKETNSENGMDIGILCIEKMPNQDSKITFAGAKNDLFYIKNDATNLQIIKGNRRAIGGKQNESIIFENQTIILPPKSWIYLSSDGLEDSCNIARKKFGRKTVISILEKNKNLTPYQQKNILKNELNDFSEGTPQRDDIFLMGIQL